MESSFDLKNSFKFNISTYYEDTDSSGYVYHTSYLRFAERARSEMLKKISPRIFKSLVKGDFLFVIKDLKIDYFKPCQLFDDLQIKSNIIGHSKCSLLINQEVFKNSETCVQIKVKLVWINILSGRPVKMPSYLISRFNSFKIV